MAARQGDDYVNAGAGRDGVGGGDGDDEAEGLAGGDHLGGGPGDDDLSGGLGDDVLSGGDSSSGGGPTSAAGPSAPEETLVDNAGPDSDQVFGGGGGELMDVEDGDPDDSLHCGPPDDSASTILYDSGDEVDLSCL